MAISFTRAPTVAPGDPITSTQFSKQALAFNDRLRSGIGDPCWRIVFWWANLFREIRNPAGPLGSSFPSMMEFFDWYQHWEATEGWPATEPGEPEGANVLNPIIAYIVGDEPRLGLLSETERYGQNLPFLQAPPNEKDAWEYAKLQRGAVNPLTGNLNCPMFTVSESFFRIRQNPRTSVYGMSYGGWLPSQDPADPNPCPDVHEGEENPPPLTPNRITRFTKIEGTMVLVEGQKYLVLGGAVTYDGTTYQPGQFFEATDVPIFTGTGTVHEVKEYPGTCNQDALHVAMFPEHVAFVSPQFRATYVYLNNGQIDVYLTNEWVEGPYLGEATLRKTDGKHLMRSLWNFMREFRGSTSQAADEKRHLEHAFDFQKFFTTQFHLAPQFAVEAVPGTLTEIYPSWGTATDTAAGASLGPAHTYYTDFVLASAYLEAIHLAQPVDVELVEGTTVRVTLTLAPDEAGEAKRLWMPEPAWSPAEPVYWRTKTPLVFTGTDGQQLKIETTELFPYMGQIQDAATLLRGMSCLASTSAPDGVGAHETEAEKISETYFKYGCLVNMAGIPGIDRPDSESIINMNAVYDAARRFSKLVRVPRRNEFTGYAVEGGKSILYFKRYAEHGGIVADVWEGIGPARFKLVNGDILDARLYLVREGTIDYNGQTYTVGQTFTGVYGVIEWVDHDTVGHTAEVFEVDGIRHTAGRQDLTNEWLLGVELVAYHTTSAVFRVDTYTDIMAFPQRCHLYSPYVANDVPLLWHTSRGQRIGGFGTLNPEIPSGWNYAELEFADLGSKNANAPAIASDEDQQNFYRSCRIYEPDVEVEKCEVEIQGDGTEIVKVTLKGRLHHCAEAPSSISRDRATWTDDLHGEPYRSHENGLREYLIDQDGGIKCAKLIGDHGVGSLIYERETVFGTCYPKIRLTKLVPKPYEDANDTQQVTDTKFMHDAHAQMELYLRIMCEGYVDGVTSAELACQLDTVSAYDFTYENLCLQAFGNRWMPHMLASDAPMNPQGFGPCPNTIARAEIFNGLSRAVNLLDTARVMIPAKTEIRNGVGDRLEYVDANHACGSREVVASTLADFGGGRGGSIVWDPDWTESTGGGASVDAGLTGNCGGGGHEVLVHEVALQVRWKLIDPNAVLALPDAWADMLLLNAAVIAGITSTSAVVRVEYVTDPLDAQGCQFPEQGHNPVIIDDQYAAFPVDTTGPTITCSALKSSWQAPSAPVSKLWRVRRADGAICGGGPSTSDTIEIIGATTPMIHIPLTP